MKVGDILNTIKSNLTGDTEADKLFLADQVKLYADHENAAEIIEEISKMIWDMMSDDEKEAIMKVSMNDTINDFIESVKPLVMEGKIDEAVERLTEFIDGYQFDFEDSDEEEFRIFNNPLEHIIYIETHRSDRKVRLIPFNENYYRLYNLYGHLLWDSGRLDESKEAFMKALKYNPVDSDSLNYLMLYYDTNRNNEEVEKIARDILKYSYDAKLIAHAYRFLGYWHYNYSDFETSAALYILSLIFEDDITAKTELCLIDEITPIRKIDAIKRLEEKDIQVGANPVIFEILMYLFGEAKKNDDVTLENFCANVFSQLVPPGEIPDRIARLEETFDDIVKLLDSNNNPFAKFGREPTSFAAQCDYDDSTDTVMFRAISDLNDGNSVDNEIKRTVEVSDGVRVGLNAGEIPVGVEISDFCANTNISKGDLNAMNFFNLFLIANRPSVLFKFFVGTPKMFNGEDIIESELRFDNTGIPDSSVSFSFERE